MPELSDVQVQLQSEVRRFAGAEIAPHATAWDDGDDAYEGACPECGELIEHMLDEKGKVPPAFLKHMKKKKGGDDGDDDKDDDDKKPGKKDESIAPSHVPGAFAVAAGRPNLSEGHSLAAATLGVMGRGKPVLTEDEG